jgi:hypothetical protein
VPALRRIATMRAKLATAENGRRFWSASFAADPWSVARELLGWRDGLVEAGWSATGADWPPRLADIADLERAGPALPPGLTDRLAGALRALAKPRPLPWPRLVLLQPREQVPGAWQRLLDRLAACGTEITERPQPKPVAGDLGRVQRVLSGGSAEALSGDGSFVVLAADTEAMAADALAAWLAAGTEAENERTLCVLASGTALLDASLRRLHLPRFRALPASPNRAVLQVLPLAFAIAWAPFDPFRLLDLLQLPRGPVPALVAHRLADALAEAPGRNNPAWVAALQEAMTARREQFAARGLAGAALEADAKRDTALWRDWVEGTLFDPAGGMPVAEALRLCGRVASWAMRRSDDKLRSQLAGIAAELSDAIGACGAARLPRPLLTRMIEQALGTGGDDPAAVAEAAPWSAVLSPGAVWGPVDTVVWWAPSAPPLPPQSPWTASERKALASAGCVLDPMARAVSTASRGWRQPVLQARRQVLLVLPRWIAGGEAAPHPLLHELRSVLAASPAVTVRAEALLDGPSRVAGRSLPRAAVPRLALAPVRRSRTVPAATLRPPTQASASSIAQLLGCPFAWVLAHQGRLHGSRWAEVPAGETLLGLLAHAVVRNLFAAGPPPDPRSVEVRTRTVLDAAIAAEAAPLLLPGAAADLQRAHDRIPAAVATLARRVADAHLEVVGTEVEASDQEKALGGVTLLGRIDLLLRDAKGRHVVLDLKWSGADKWRQSEVADGRPLQLATYARLLHDKGAVSAGYFMLAQRRLIATDAWPFPADHVPGTDLPAFWQEIVAGWSEALATVQQGRLVARGVEVAADEAAEPAPAGLVLDPPCRFCEFGRLCGQRPLT